MGRGRRGARLGTGLVVALATAWAGGGVAALADEPALAARSAGSGSVPTRCVPLHLALQVGAAQVAAGSVFTDVYLRNAGSQPCRLQGFPAVELLDAAGQPAAFTAGREGPAGSGFVVAPGGTGQFTLHTFAPTGYPGCVPPPVTQIRITAPEQTSTLTNAILLTACGGRFFRTSLTPGPGGAGPPQSTSGGRCRVANVALQIGPRILGEPGRYVYQAVILRNAGTVRCNLDGYPAASFLDPAGREVGSRAGRLPDTPRKVLLSPGQVGSFVLRSPACSAARTATFLRVHPPDDIASLVTQDPALVCPTPAPAVTAVQPGASPRSVPSGTTAALPTKERRPTVVGARVTLPWG